MRARPIALTLATLLALAAPASVHGQDYKEKKPKVKQDKATRAERLKQAEGLFRSRDKDHNGVVERDEAPKNWFVAYDLDGNEKINVKEFTEILMHPVLKAAHPMRHPRARAANSLRQFDRDKNGVVQKDEYPGGMNIFKRADRNNDDKLDWKELLRLAKDELKANRKKMKSPGRYDFLQLFDLNRDRNVSSAEYDGPARVFAKFDKNDDGTVSYGELYPERMRENMRYAEAMKPKPMDKTVLKAMDKNDDGKISREEFKGTAAAWQRMDKNRDGWITLADAR